MKVFLSYDINVFFMWWPNIYIFANTNQLYHVNSNAAVPSRLFYFWPESDTWRLGNITKSLLRWFPMLNWTESFLEYKNDMLPGFCTVNLSVQSLISGWLVGFFFRGYKTQSFFSICGFDQFISCQFSHLFPKKADQVQSIWLGFWHAHWVIIRACSSFEFWI